jgi:colicin import membrane protein
MPKREVQLVGIGKQGPRCLDMMRVWVLLVSGACLTIGALAQGTRQVSRTEVSEMRDIIGSCLRKHWRLPTKGQPVSVTVRWRLEKDGKLLSPPEILGQQMTPEIKPSAERARQAIRACQPFKLPPERYHAWKTITWEFEPTAMSN